MQAQIAQKQLGRAKAELAFLEKMGAILPPEILAAAPVLTDNGLYGATASILFKAGKIRLADLLQLVEPVDVQNWSGAFWYTIPASYDITKEKDAKAVFRGQNDLIERISPRGYKIEFYAKIDDCLFDFSIDFMHLIIGNQYSSLATGIKLPHLVENRLYSNNGGNGAKYFGRNGAGDTNNHEIQQRASFQEVFRLIEQEGNL